MERFIPKIDIQEARRKLLAGIRRQWIEFQWEGVDGGMPSVCFPIPENLNLEKEKNDISHLSTCLEKDGSSIFVRDGVRTTIGFGSWNVSSITTRVMQLGCVCGECGPEWLGLNRRDPKIKELLTIADREREEIKQIWLENKKPKIK